MNSHQLGDEYERICREYLMELWAEANPQLIETKINDIHGIDFAMSLNDGEIVFIVESKGKYSQVSKKQMSKEWIKDRINGELAEKIKTAIGKNGIIKYLSFRINNDDPKNPIIKRISPSGFLDKEELINSSDNINSNNHLKSKNKMASKRSLEYQRELLISLKKYLEDFQGRVLKDLDMYQKKVEALHEGANMADELYSPFKQLYFDPSKQLMEKLMVQMQERDLKKINQLIIEVGRLIDISGK
jgi:hypothetical protein